MHTAPYLARILAAIIAAEGQRTFAPHYLSRFAGTEQLSGNTENDPPSHVVFELAFIRYFRKEAWAVGAGTSATSGSAETLLSEAHLRFPTRSAPTLVVSHVIRISTMDSPDVDLRHTPLGVAQVHTSRHGNLLQLPRPCGEINDYLTAPAPLTASGAP
eukprot:scaffold206280_cov28-Tisochrysis_lutea.AAC.6